MVFTTFPSISIIILSFPLGAEKVYIVFSSRVFFEEIREYLDNKFGDYDVLLRLNCEGVEDEVIFCAHQQLSNKLKLICGSLKDVEELKGKQAAEDLDSYMENHGLPFVKFSSGIYSWHEAHSMILSLVKDDEK